MDGGTLLQGDAQTGVVPSVSIENMLRKRTAVVDRLQQIVDLTREAEEISVSAGLGSMGWIIDDLRYQECRTLDRSFLESCTKRMDVCGWRTLMSESGLWSFMDAKAREDWNKRLEKFEAPEFTADNINATFSMLYASRGEIFERGVINVFQQLSWHYRTNLPHKFGKRLILSALLYERLGKGVGYGSPHHRTTDKLDDLLRVLYVLDRKPEPDHRNGSYVMVADGIHEGKAGTENDYIRLKWFKNGNGHLEFRRLDLVEKMNAIIAKHFPNALPTPYRDKGR